jgi:uncharacterized protein
MSETVQIRDPIHNFIALGEEDVKIVNSPLFQRLRGIRQLAMANLVYPGALHTRFDHSLGVFHVAGLMADQLGITSDDKRLVQIAALLHDLGHGPFSHVSEKSLDIFADRSCLPAAQKKEKIHELVTANLIRQDKDLQEILGGVRTERIVKLLNKWDGDPLLRSVVSGPLDADKLDYLLRDTYFCGVAYGKFDFYQLLRSFVVKEQNGEKQLMLKETGVNAFEQYALAKYYMTLNVYRHKGRMITDEMITRAIALGYEVDRLKTLIELYQFNNTPNYYRNYIEWDDARFMVEFAGPLAKPGKCRDMLCKLKERKLLKRIFSRPVADFADIPARQALGNYEATAETRDLRKKLEYALASVISEDAGYSVDPDFVIFNKVTVKSARMLARNDAEVLVIDQNMAEQVPQQVDEKSILLNSMDEKAKTEFVDVYAPVEWETHLQRRRKHDRLNDTIATRIVEILKTEQQPLTK